ncbi:hypothetical protein C3B54_111266 [Pontimonas salivibrio]|uniref:Uncharacterized protein n=1 Tax=Pontimonas salivibrio TaxID=1159327 RepID=A0A2L2BRB8_9MICO|nr:hypothetical protein [Pontimonas salivibrio]AVG24216.1 hypothetical protein C3B54_111266 [Pontimonas salivibrio]
MENLISLGAGIAIIAALIWFVSKVLSIWSETFSTPSTKTLRPAETSRSGPDANGDHPDGMNEGDFHSGRGGYEPGTAYPDTHYGEYGRDE